MEGWAGSKKAGLTDAPQLKILPDLAAKVLAACMLVGGGIETTEIETI